MEVETEAWRVNLNPRTWLTGRHAKGDGVPVEKRPEQIPTKKKVSIIPPAVQEPELREGAVPKDGKSKREQKITMCFLKKKKFPCPLKPEPEPSFNSLCNSCNNNCCRVCAIICKYVQDMVSCVYCIVNCTCPHTNFCLLLRQLVSATCAVCADCVYIIRHILKCLVGVKE
ncbi:uncharacterized protein LOC113496837 [Trichoplusia ni]|uniref:Uncharacterized protein LOC113496837 n=1 Tax=Trichoplusia ni TaxID=7111 RepID=A0A7E5VV41_TRINI|nr:uncharacterized protein LOC113496837 [Trichoplusia ni]